MLKRSTKAAYYGLFYAPMRINALRHRLLPNAELSKKVHLGPGRGNYIEGWTNVDANFLTAKIDLWADLRGKLPFQERSVDAFYSHHVIEHLPDRLLPFHFRELFRTLKPGGAIRIAGPNADSAIKKFSDGDITWFSDFPDKRSSLGGRFANFILCGGEHLTILTSSYLRELATAAGFTQILFCRPVNETNFPEVFGSSVLGKEWESSSEYPHTLVMEAQRPKEPTILSRAWEQAR